jgi:hypothetical protein
VSCRGRRLGPTASGGGVLLEAYRSFAPHTSPGMVWGGFPRTAGFCRPFRISDSAKISQTRKAPIRPNCADDIDTVGVVGSIPIAPTNQASGTSIVSEVSTFCGPSTVANRVANRRSRGSAIASTTYGAARCTLVRCSPRCVASRRLPAGIGHSDSSCIMCVVVVDSFDSANRRTRAEEAGTLASGTW